MPNIKKYFHGIMLLFGYNMCVQGNVMAQEQRFHLNHVDLCVDSISYHALLRSLLTSDSFAYIKIFSDSTGSEILVFGSESYIHIFPDKGFFANRVGSCFPVHHSYQWKSSAEHLAFLQKFTRDSLYIRPYISENLHIDYINVFEEDGKSNRLMFAPILQNPSKNDYISYGYSEKELLEGISQKRYMSDYVGKETKDKLFRTIQTITISLEKVERNEMEGFLKGYGYRKKGKKYQLHGSPLLKFSQIKDGQREIAVKILLIKKCKPATMQISDNLALSIKGQSARLMYRVAEP